MHRSILMTPLAIPHHRLFRRRYLTGTGPTSPTATFSAARRESVDFKGQKMSWRTIRWWALMACTSAAACAQTGSTTSAADNAAGGGASRRAVEFGAASRTKPTDGGAANPGGADNLPPCPTPPPYIRQLCIPVKR